MEYDELVYRTPYSSSNKHMQDRNVRAQERWTNAPAIIPRGRPAGANLQFITPRDHARRSGGDREPASRKGPGAM